MLKAIKNNIILEKEIKPFKTTSGIILSTKKEEKEDVAKVVNIGQDVKGININDVVVFESYKAKKIKDNDKTFIIVKDEDVLAIIEE